MRPRIASTAKAMFATYGCACVLIVPAVEQKLSKCDIVP